ncbi:MAG: hypothetical protein MJ085_03850 [Clostridia bacterium]|nr:hypothetical protein [Clostridia bacterium]
MKQIRKCIALLFAMLIFASLILTGCTAPRFSYTDEQIQNQVKSAAKARVRMTADTGEFKGYKVSKQKDGRKQVEAITVDQITNQGDVWTAVGTAVLENTTDKSDKLTVSFELKVKLIDYVTETPMLSFLDFSMQLPENAD